MRRPTRDLSDVPAARRGPRPNRLRCSPSHAVRRVTHTVPGAHLAVDGSATDVWQSRAAPLEAVVYRAGRNGTRSSMHGIYKVTLVLTEIRNMDAAPCVKRFVCRTRQSQHNVRDG